MERNQSHGSAQMSKQKCINYREANLNSSHHQGTRQLRKRQKESQECRPQRQSHPLTSEEDRQDRG